MLAARSSPAKRIPRVAVVPTFRREGTDWIPVLFPAEAGQPVFTAEEIAKRTRNHLEALWRVTFEPYLDVLAQG